MGDSAALKRRLAARLTAAPWVRDTGFALYRLSWFALLAIAIISPAAGVYYREQMIARVLDPFALAGLGYDVREDYRLRLRPRSAEAHAAGLTDGELPVAIDGVPVSDAPSAMPELARRLAGAEGSTLILTTRLRDGTLATRRLTRSEANIESIYAGTGIDQPTYRALQLILGIFPNYLLIAAAVLLFRRRARDPVAAVLSLSFLMMAANMFHAYFWYQHFDLLALSGIWAVGGWCGFILVLAIFPDGRFVPRWSRWAALLLIPLAAQSYLYLFSWQVDSLLYLAGLATGIACLAVRYRRLPPGAERQQIRWAMLGFATGTVSIASGIIVQIVAATDTGPVSEVWGAIGAQVLLTVGLSFYAGGLLVSLLKYRLYDADAVISRSAGYAVMTVGLVGVFAATERMIEILGERYFEGDVGALSGGIAAGMAAVVIGPMHGRIHNWAERRFQQALQRMRRELPLCVGDLRETAGMDALLAELLVRIERGVRASRLAVLLDGKVAALRGTSVGEVAEANPLPAAAEGLVCDRTDPLFPLRIPLEADQEGAAPFGWILLGPRPDGSFYGRGERGALAEIADPVARAVRIVQLREAREEESRRRVARQNKRLSALERALAALAAPKPLGI